VNPVVQEEPTGCGIASAAAIAGISYEQARRAAAALGIRAVDETLWSQTQPVRNLLAHFGVRTSAVEIPFSAWDALPDLALLATKWHLERGKPYWHWAVFWRGGDGAVVLDSKKALRTHARRDFGRIRPRWYIEVLR
jgi:hypothetical protein